MSTGIGVVANNQPPFICTDKNLQIQKANKVEIYGPVKEGDQVIENASDEIKETGK